MKNTSRIFSLLAIAFLIFVFQYSTVWLNEELLLAISFSIFYVVSYTKLKDSMNEFFLERKNSFSGNPMSLLKNLALTDLKLQKQLQVYTALNITSFVKESLAQQHMLLNNALKEIALTKKNVFAQKCINLLKFEASYKQKMLNQLTSGLIDDMFQVETQMFLNNNVFMRKQDIDTIEINDDIALLTLLLVKKS